MPKIQEINGYTPTEIFDPVLEKIRAEIKAQLQQQVLSDAPYDPHSIGPNRPGWNTAVGQIFFLMNALPDMNGSLKLKEAASLPPKVNGEVKTPFRNDFQILPIVNTDIKPGSLIDTFVTDTELEPYTLRDPHGMPELLQKKIGIKNGAWLLCGAIGPSSIFDMLYSLDSHGFSGRLDVVDSGEHSFATLATFSDTYAYYFPDITVNLVNANLLYASLDPDVTKAEARATTLADTNDDGVYLPYYGYDGITADTIGTYISEDTEIHMHFGIIFHSLRSGGLAFVRDMATGIEEINSERQHITQTQKAPTTIKAQQLQEYIATNLNISVPFEYCYAVISKLFSSKLDNQELRWTYLNDLWCVSVPAEIAVIRNFVTEGSSINQRWFAEFVFQKE